VNFLTRIAFLTTKQVGVISLILAFVFYQTMFDDGSDLEPVISQERANLAMEQERKTTTDKALEKRDRLQEILSKLTDRYEELSRQIPTEISDYEVNKQINSLIQAARIRPLARKPLEQVNIGVLEELPYELKLQGGFNEMAQLVYMISTAERVMVVKKIKVVPQEPYDGRLVFEMTVAAYKLATKPADKVGVR